MSQKSQDSAAKQNAPKPELIPAVEGLTAESQVARAAAALQRLASAPDDPLDPGDVLALQRTVGNQVARRTLGVGESGRVAPSPRVTLAANRARATVQREGTGITKGETVKEFAEGARGMESEWANLSAEQRANKLGALANAALATIKVPPVAIIMKELGSSNGAFDSAAWTLEINTTIISKDSVTEGELASVSKTFFHEARHAEQYFRVARLQAGVGWSEAKIAKHLRIPGRIAKAAMEAPIKPPDLLELFGDETERVKEWKEAREWAYSLGPLGRERYGRIIRELEAAEKAMEAAVAAYQASPTDENKDKAKDARKTYKRKYRAYRRLAEEKDAFKAGSEAREAFESAGGEGS
jgi:hypothetical protein